MASLTAPRRISTLDAINIMLSNLGEGEVSSYGPESKPTAQKAASRLAEESIAVQSDGYNFSTIRELKLSPSPLTGEIILPDNILSWHPVGQSASMEIIELDGKLYDAKMNTFSFATAVTVEATLAHPFESLPQPARHYITLRAAIAFTNSENPGGQHLRVTMDMLQEAKARLDAYDRRLRKGGLRAHNPHVKRLRGNR